MSTKTIPQLTEVTSVDENVLLVIDTGTVTRKITLENLLGSIEAVQAPSRGVFQTANATIAEDDRYTFVTGTTTVTLPPAAAVEGKTFLVKNIDTGGLVTTIEFDGAETCDGLTNLSLPERYDFFEVFSDGTNWHIVGW